MAKARAKIDQQPTRKDYVSKFCSRSRAYQKKITNRRMKLAYRKKEHQDRSISLSKAHHRVASQKKRL
jgi:hypothetical protein